jgi:hypothetical protein
VARLFRSLLFGAVRDGSGLFADSQMRQWRALPGADVRRVPFVLLVRQRNLRHPELLKGHRLPGWLLCQRKLCRLPGRLPTMVPLSKDEAPVWVAGRNRSTQVGQERRGSACKLPPESGNSSAYAARGRVTVYSADPKYIERKERRRTRRRT